MTSHSWDHFVAKTSPYGLGLEISSARGSLIFTRDGEKYIDFISGIAVNNLGHCHPQIVHAICDQANRYSHTMVYGEHDQGPQSVLAAEIANWFGRDYQVFFTNSGTEAMELALKMAMKMRPNAHTFIRLSGGFHGRTLGAMSVSSNTKYKEGFWGFLDCVERGTDVSSWVKVPKKAFKAVTGIVLELCQGEAGAKLLPQKFVDHLIQLRKLTGVPLIVDEVQTGFGRTGSMFLQDAFGFKADITTLGKAMGGGLPLGGVVSTRKNFETLQTPPFSHVTTFGGNPVSCAAGLASWNVIRDMLPFISAQSHFFGQDLEVLEREFPDLLGKSSGIGYLRALNFKDPEFARMFVEGCQEGRVLVGYKLNNSTAVRLAPPLNIEKDLYREAFDIMKEALKKVEHGRNDVV